MDNIDVSVIIPVFNASKYICKTLNSIINQDFENYEIIVIDDGSTDDSLEIINNTLKNTEIPHKIIHQENSGVSSARNRGIEVSTGEYIVFIDADDYVTPNHLSVLYNGQSDFSLTLFVKKEEDNISKPFTYDWDVISTREFLEMELKMQIVFNFFQLMYKADIIKNNNIKFTPGIIYGEDIEFVHKVLAYGTQIVINNEVTYYYVQHDESAIKTSQYTRFEIVKIFERLSEFYKKNNKPEMANLIITSRIPKAIFGNMNFFFYNGYDFDEVFNKMKELNLLNKLSKYEGDFKFKLKIKLFLLSPKLYYKLWMKFKKSID